VISCHSLDYIGEKYNLGQFYTTQTTRGAFPESIVSQPHSKKKWFYLEPEMVPSPASYMELQNGST